MDGKEVTIVDNKTRVPANTFTEKLTPSVRGNYPLLFNPQTQNCMVEIAGTRAYQVLEDKEPSVDYEQHETALFFKPRSKLSLNYKRDFEAARQAFKDIVNQKNIETRLEEFKKKTEGIVTTEDGQPLVVTEPFFIEEAVVCALDTDVRSDVEIYLSGHDIPFDFYAGVVTATMYRFGRQTISGELATKVAALMNTRKWSVLHERLTELFDIYHEPYWNKLHDGITKAINDYFKYQLGITTRIDSFIDDGLGMVEYIEANYGSAFCDKLETACSRICASVFTVANSESEEFKQFFGSDGPEVDDGSRFRCALVDIECVTFLRIHSSDLNMSYVGGFGRVDAEGEYADLWKAIDKIFDYQHDQGVPFRSTRMVTIDGEEIYIAKAEFGDSYLIWKGR